MTEGSYVSQLICLMQDLPLVRIRNSLSRQRKLSSHPPLIVRVGLSPIFYLLLDRMSPIRQVALVWHFRRLSNSPADCSSFHRPANLFQAQNTSSCSKSSIISVTSRSEILSENSEVYHFQKKALRRCLQGQYSNMSCSSINNSLPSHCQ